MSLIVDSLRGEAARAATDLGDEVLLKDEGIKKLCEAIKALAFPVARSEAKILYKSYNKTTGTLSIQSGESIPSYIQRRRRAWADLKVLDPTIELSDEIKGDLLSELVKRRKEVMLLVLCAGSRDAAGHGLGTQLLVQPPLVSVPRPPSLAN